MLWLPLLAAFLYLMAGCREDKETSIPVIQFDTPQFRQEFTVLDTIAVKALITDRQNITYVKVNLTDANFVPISSSLTYSPDAPSFELETRLWIEDATLASGTYHVLVRAENESAFKNKYQEVLLHGIEQEFRQLLIITEGGFSKVRVSGTHDFDLVQELFTIQGDYAASAISQAHQLLFMAGQNSPNIQAWSLSGNTLAWEVELPPGQPVHSKDCLYFGESLYATYHHDFIRGYSPEGMLQFNVFTDESDAPENVHRIGDYVLVDMQKKNIADAYLATYFAGTGNLKQKRFISFDVVRFHAGGENVVYITANGNGTGKIYSYDVVSDILTPEKELDAGVNCSVMTESGTIILGCDAAIYAFSTIQGTLVKVLDEGAETMAFEHLDGSLVMGSDLKVEVYQFPEMVNQKTLLFSDPILDLLIQYSK